MNRSFHQILVGAAAGDAITSMALALQVRLRELGPSEIYAHNLSGEMTSKIFRLRDLPPGSRHDVLTYHASYGEPEVTRVLMQRNEPVVLAYHNITPAEFFIQHDAQFASGLNWGRKELAIIHPQVVLAVADSQFNADDLCDQGYTDVHVVPGGLRPTALTAVSPNPALASRLDQQFPAGFVLGVSQLLPHKAFEDLVAAMHLAQWVLGSQLGLVITGWPRSAAYTSALKRLSRQLNVQRISFTGGLDDADLATYYRKASMFVSLSRHEGLGVPPLEAMAFGTPVIARAAGATRETIGAAGLLLPEDAGAQLVAEAIVELNTNQALRDTFRARGYERVRQIEADDGGERFISLLRGLI